MSAKAKAKDRSTTKKTDKMRPECEVLFNDIKEAYNGISRNIESMIKQGQDLQIDLTALKTKVEIVINHISTEISVLKNNAKQRNTMNWSVVLNILGKLWQAGLTILVGYLLFKMTR